ncbi:MAG TPA: DM9 repeat-containing protein [Burkholderiales bacterium]|nr:DM9 repeat-containing protein [Burkholderiales bacterium]
MKFRTHLRRLAPAALAAVAFAAAAANEPDLNWVNASRGVIPKGSLGVGQDVNGKVLYACRARLANGADVPGKIREPLIGCSVLHGGLEWSLASYQVLRDDPKAIRWVSGNSVPPRAYPVGREADGTAVFLCRAKRADGSVQVGKLGSSGACAYGFGGKEEQVAEFEVLVRP